MEVHMTVEAGAGTADEGHRTDLQSTPSHIFRIGAVVLLALRDDPQKNTRQHVHLSLAKEALYETPNCWAEVAG